MRQCIDGLAEHDRRERDSGVDVIEKREGCEGIERKSPSSSSSSSTSSLSTETRFHVLGRIDIIRVGEGGYPPIGRAGG